MHILLGYGYSPGTAGAYFERALAREHQVTYVGTPWEDRPGYAPTVDLAQLAAALPVPPDLFLYVDNGNVFYAPTGLESLPCPTAAYLIDAWPPFVTTQRNTYRLRLARLFDYVFVAHPGAVDLFSRWRGGLPVEWLPLACDPQIHGDQHLDRIYDVGFVGQRSRAYPERERILAALAARYRINDLTRPYYLKDMARIYSQAKVGVNTSFNDILPMRFFEVMAAGALLLTPASSRNGQDRLAGLVEGRHFVTFRTLDDLIDRIDYYLAHPAERDALASAARDLVLSRHTYGRRAQQVLEHIARDGARRQAPLRALTAEQQARAYIETHALMRLADASLAPAFEGLPRGRKWRARAWQLGMALGAVLRRIKHEWR
jgi:hypothetical protein